MNSALGRIGWIVAVTAIGVGLALPRVIAAPALVPLALALLVGIAKSGTA